MTQVTGRRRWWIVLLGVLIAYLLLAYVLLPALWSHHEHEPGLASLPMVTRTADGVPGDALNVGLVRAGTMSSAPCTLPAGIPQILSRCARVLRSSAAWRLTGHTMMRRSVPLYHQGKKEQLAFEKPDGKSADRRHHVRFWQVLDKGTDGRPVWLGSVTFDRGVGLSHDTGQVTHPIAPDIDAERDGLMRDLREAGMVQNFFQISGTGPTLFGRNGEGDPYSTRTARSTSPPW